MNHRLVRIRWAVRGALTLGVAASVAANVLHAHPNLISQTIAAWPPLALLLTIELISRVPVQRQRLARARLAATGAIASIAAWVSYWHMAGVAARYGEQGASAYLLPLSVDGLVVVASVCLVELAERIRTERVPMQPPATELEQQRSGTASTRRTGTSKRRRTSPRSDVRTDAELLQLLADVPREQDGSVPVRRAAAALGCGPDRARRLLKAARLLRNPVAHAA